MQSTGCEGREGNIWRPGSMPVTYSSFSQWKFCSLQLQVPFLRNQEAEASKGKVRKCESTSCGVPLLRVVMARETAILIISDGIDK